MYTLMSAAAGGEANGLYEQVADHMRAFVRDSVINHPKLIPELKRLIEDPDNTWAARAFLIGMRPQNAHDPSWNQRPMLDTLVKTVLDNIPPEQCPGLAQKRPGFEENLQDVFKDVLTYDTLAKGILSTHPLVRGFARGSKFEHKYAPPGEAPTPFSSPEYAPGVPPAPAVDPELETVVDQLLSDIGIPKGAMGVPNRGYEKVARQFGQGRRTKKYKKRTRRRRSTSRRPRA